MDFSIKTKQQFTLTRGPSRKMWWEKDGTCFEQIDDEPVKRRSDLDWGTPNGDLIVAPWMQKAITKKDA